MGEGTSVLNSWQLRDPVKLDCQMSGKDLWVHPLTLLQRDRVVRILGKLLGEAGDAIKLIDRSGLAGALSESDENSGTLIKSLGDLFGGRLTGLVGEVLANRENLETFGFVDEKIQRFDPRKIDEFKAYVAQVLPMSYEPLVVEAFFKVQPIQEWLGNLMTLLANLGASSEGGQDDAEESPDKDR